MTVHKRRKEYGILSIITSVDKMEKRPDVITALNVCVNVCVSQVSLLWQKRLRGKSSNIDHLRLNSKPYFKGLFETFFFFNEYLIDNLSSNRIRYLDHFLEPPIFVLVLIDPIPKN
ncbi:ribose-phosphate pyrophosphokinase 1 [Sarcoptes scabiei]|nr:ribose-phosphate pyrophosphokinase 1 [Sarcoptes scabiei]